MKQHSIYERCSKHPEQFLQVICMQCKHRNLACPQCIDIQHSNHSIISLKKFIRDEIPKLYVQRLDFEQTSQCFKKLGQSFTEKFQKMRKAIGTEINELQLHYQLQIQRLIRQTEVICGIGTHLYTEQNIFAIKQKLAKQEKIDGIDKLKDKIINLQNMVNQSIFQKINEISHILKGLKDLWRYTKDIMLNTHEINQCTFSTINKHKDITISKDALTSTNQVYDSKYTDIAGSYHMVVVQPALTPFNNKISFKINATQNKCIWLGVCHLNIVRQKHFTNCFKNGEGAYWIWQAGLEGGAQFFSHIPLDQVEQLGWNFDVGEIVRITVNYHGQFTQLIFEKLGKKYSVDLKVKGIGLYACVAMGDQSQSVSIIEA